MTIEAFCKDLDSSLAAAACSQEKVRQTEQLLARLTSESHDWCTAWDCCQERYARHLVYHGPQSGCCVVAMAWGPGQGTPVHDHDGVWCVECCLQGKLEVIRYDLQDKLDDAGEPVYVFFPVEAQFVGQGSVGSLIPPFEHHQIRNASSDKAITLHVYGKELLKSSCFEPLGADRYRRVERHLFYAEA